MKNIKKPGIIWLILFLLITRETSLAKDTAQQKSETSNSISTNFSKKNNQAPKAVIKIQKGHPKGEVPFSLNLDGSESKDPEGKKLIYEWKYPNNKIITSKNPQSYRFKEAGNYEISLTVTDIEGLSETDKLKIEAKEKAKKNKSSKISTKLKFQNGDLSSAIIINEVFPNPKGKDETKEWLELYNSGNQNLNLGNWMISQSKLNSATSKPKIITLSDQLDIKAKSYLILDNFHLKSLANQQNKIELLDYKGQTIDSITYEKTKENLSLSKISLKNSENPNFSKKILNWIEPTKNSANPAFYQIQGIITKTEVDFLILQTKSDKEIKIYFKNEPKPGKSKYKSQLNQTLLRKGTEILALTEKYDNKFSLKSYKMLKAEPIVDLKESSNSADSWLINLFKISIAIIFLAIATLWFLHSSSHCK